MGSPARTESLVDDTLAAEAIDLLSVDRMIDYGHPAENLDRTAQLWSAVLKTDVDASQVAMCLALMKISRQAHAPMRDNIVDAIAYLMLADTLSR